MHRTEVSAAWSAGLRVARVDTVAKLAGSIEVEPGEFFDGIKWEPGNVRLGHFVSNVDRRQGSS